MLGNILGDVDGITLGIYVGTELGSLYVSFDGFNNGKIEGLFLENSLGCTDVTVIGSDEFIKLRSTDGKVLGNILE